MRRAKVHPSRRRRQEKGAYTHADRGLSLLIASRALLPCCSTGLPNASLVYSRKFLSAATQRIERRPVDDRTASHHFLRHFAAFFPFLLSIPRNISPRSTSLSRAAAVGPTSLLLSAFATIFAFLPPARPLFFKSVARRK